MSHLGKTDFNPDVDIPGLSGKVIVVIGDNTEIGKEACFGLVEHHPAKIFILAHNSTSGQSTINDIKAASLDVKANFIECNLASFRSVKNVDRHIISSATRLDLLFCNAGSERSS